MSVWRDGGRRSAEQDGVMTAYMGELTLWGNGQYILESWYNKDIGSFSHAALEDGVMSWSLQV